MVILLRVVNFLIQKHSNLFRYDNPNENHMSLIGTNSLSIERSWNCHLGFSVFWKTYNRSSHISPCSRLEGDPGFAQKWTCFLKKKPLLMLYALVSDFYCLCEQMFVDLDVYACRCAHVHHFIDLPPAVLTALHVLWFQDVVLELYSNS